MPHGIFDVVPKHPEIQHVARNMHPATMHEHGGENRQEFISGRESGKLGW